MAVCLSVCAVTVKVKVKVASQRADPLILLQPEVALLIAVSVAASSEHAFNVTGDRSHLPNLRHSFTQATPHLPTP